jgi:hypothetical protein
VKDKKRQQQPVCGFFQISLFDIKLGYEMECPEFLLPVNNSKGDSRSHPLSLI